MWGRLRIGARLAFARSLGDAVHGEVLGRRSNLIILLHRLSHLHAEPRNEIWILAVSIFNSSPALVARNVQRRGVHIRITKRASLIRSDAANLADQLFVPRVALS